MREHIVARASTYMPGIGQEELWDELLHIGCIGRDAAPGVPNRAEHPVRRIKLTILQPASAMSHSVRTCLHTTHMQNMEQLQATGVV